MNLVAKITSEKATELSGTEYSRGCLFNPIQDADDNWIISFTEAQYLNVEDFTVITFKEKEYAENI